MKKLATLFQDSYNELKHVRTVTTIAMFASIGIILGSLTVRSAISSRSGFPALPISLCTTCLVRQPAVFTEGLWIF